MCIGGDTSQKLQISNLNSPYLVLTMPFSERRQYSTTFISVIFVLKYSFHLFFSKANAFTVSFKFIIQSTNTVNDKVSENNLPYTDKKRTQENMETNEQRIECPALTTLNNYKAQNINPSS